jgi:hypothetical protein
MKRGRWCAAALEQQPEESARRHRERAPPAWARRSTEQGDMLAVFS